MIFDGTLHVNPVFVILLVIAVYKLITELYMSFIATFFAAMLVVLLSVVNAVLIRVKRSEGTVMPALLSRLFGIEL